MFFTFVLFVGPQFIFPSLGVFHLAKLSAGLALVVYLLDRLCCGRSITVMTPAVRVLLYLSLLSLLSIPFSRWPGGSVNELTNNFLKSILVFFLVANKVTTVRRMKLLIGSMAVWGIVMAWTGVRDYASGNMAYSGLRIAGYESPLTADPNDLALTLNLVLGLLLGLYLASDNLLKRLPLLATMIFLAAGIVASFSRGGFLTLLALLGFLLFKQIKQRGLVALAPFLLLLVLALPLLPRGYGERMYSIYDTSTDTTGSADIRWKVMVEGLKLMLENPLVGLGLGMHGLEFPNRGLGWTGVHSAFIQIGADLGVPGFLLYLLLIWELFKGLRQSRAQLTGSPEDRELHALGTGIEISLVAYVVGGFLLPVAYRFYLYYIAGLAVAFQEITQRHNANLASRVSPTGIQDPVPQV
jgi:O-antigen ligase